jgi:arginase family enzyme
VDKGDRAKRRFPRPDRRAIKHYIREIARVCQRLACKWRSRAEGALPIVIGGDHSLAAGS